MELEYQVIVKPDKKQKFVYVRNKKIEFIHQSKTPKHFNNKKINNQIKIENNNLNPFLTIQTNNDLNTIAVFGGNNIEPKKQYDEININKELIKKNNKKYIDINTNIHNNINNIIYNKEHKNIQINSNKTQKNFKYILNTSNLTNNYNSEKR